MKNVDRRMIAGSSDRCRCCSMRPCQSNGGSGDPTCAPSVESFTIRDTPAEAAASMTVVSCSTFCGPSAEVRKKVVYTLQSTPQGCRIREVTWGKFDAVAERPSCSSRIPYESTNRDITAP